MIERTIEGNKRQISLYLDASKLALIDKEALEHDKSRNELLRAIIEHHYPDDITEDEKEDQEQNGTGQSINGDSDYGIPRSEF